MKRGESLKVFLFRELHVIPCEVREKEKEVLAKIAYPTQKEEQKDST